MWKVNKWQTPSDDKNSHGLLQHYVIKFASELQQVGDFLRVFLFESGIKHHQANNININA
jgi:hypothetical protein